MKHSPFAPALCPLTLARELSHEELYDFRLYVSGVTPRAMRALAALCELCEARPMRSYSIDVVDVLKAPERTMEDCVMATPTVIRTWPLPQLRWVGNLTDDAAAAEALGLR